MRSSVVWSSRRLSSRRDRRGRSPDPGREAHIGQQSGNRALARRFFGRPKLDYPRFAPSVCEGRPAAARSGRGGRLRRLDPCTRPAEPPLDVRLVLGPRRSAADQQAVLADPRPLSRTPMRPIDRSADPRAVGIRSEPRFGRPDVVRVVADIQPSSVSDQVRSMGFVAHLRRAHAMIGSETGAARPSEHFRPMGPAAVVQRSAAAGRAEPPGGRGDVGTV